jgi:hypothetical protein
MMRRLARTIAVALVAAGCASVRLEPTSGGWTVQGEDAGRTATARTGDVETLVRLAGPDGEFPLDATLLNYGPAPLAVRIVPHFKCPNDMTIGEIRGDALRPGPATPFGRANELLIPAAVDGAPGVLRVALRRDPASCDGPYRAMSLEDNHAEAPYELVVRTAEGEVGTPMDFGVERIVKGGTALKIAVVVLVVAAVVVLVCVAGRGSGGHGVAINSGSSRLGASSTSPPPSPPSSDPGSAPRKPRRTP